jgi:hypothetical protein
MPATSEKQAKFFRLVRLCQKEGKCFSKKIRDTASSISSKAAHDFAATKSKGIKENSFVLWAENKRIEDLAKEIDFDVSEFDIAELKKGFETEKEHSKGKMAVAKSERDILKIAIDHLQEDPKYYTKLLKAKL